MAATQKVVKLKAAEAPPEVPAAMPELLKIGHYFYSVRSMDELEQAKTGNLGYCDDANLEIGIAEQMPDQIKVEVMIHEIMHALFEVQSLRHAESLQEEAVVTGLSKGLVGVLIDNPGLIEWMAATNPGIKLP